MAGTSFTDKINKYKDRLKKKELIRKIFWETGATERDAKNTANALRAIMGDLYTEPERFVFELLQNADDQPKEGTMVEVKLKTLNENLLFLHTGKPFSEQDVESISSIGDSTKKNDTEKTGYKGIGFKSVFSDSETVFINSGNFSFAFDKHSPVYLKEANMDEIPWQIKPIWEEKYRLPREIQNEEGFFSSPVAIALNVGVKNIASYDRIIPKLLSEPRFVLFLRNIGKIDFEYMNGNIIEIQKTINNNIVQVHAGEITENWVVQDYIISIPQEMKDEMQNEKLIPAKLKEATKTKITFAAKVDDNKIVPVKDSVLFTYLPTKVTDFDFPFLVNADFLTTASRESIHFKNIWNRFLFMQIGHLLADWTSSLTEYGNALCILPTKEFEEENPLFADFNNAYNEALGNKAFIKGHKGDILSQDDIILDTTGLSGIVGKDLFCKILGTDKQLPYYESDGDILENEIFRGIDVIEYKDIEKLLFENNKLLCEWYIDAEEGAKAKFNEWSVDNNSKDIILALPLFHYSDGWKSSNDIDNDKDCILLSEKLSCIKEILHKLGFKCPDSYIESCPFTDYIKKTDEEDLFDKIVERAGEANLSPEEKLLIATTKFEGVGDRKLAQINLFCNEKGEKKALEGMISYRKNAPDWLKPYVLCEMENFAQISDYLIQDEEIYNKIVVKDFKEIVKYTSLVELYAQFEDSWTLAFTNKIIDSFPPQETLNFVEIQQHSEAKKYYLQKISKIELDVTVECDENDPICRMLRLAFDVYPGEKIRNFASNLYVGNRNVTSFTVSDEVSLEYHEKKKLRLKLSDLLPNVIDADIIRKIKESLSPVFKSPELDRLLALSPMSPKDIWSKMDKTKGYTVAQYLLGIYQTRKIYHYQSSVPNIDLSNVGAYWIKELLDTLYDQKVELYNDSFGYRLSPYFKNHFFSCGYVIDAEKILPVIESWADNDDKKRYLTDLGVKTEKAALVQLRKSIINNKPVSVADIASQKEYIESSIKLFVSKGVLPFNEGNQIDAMKEFKRFSRDFSTQCNTDVLRTSSSEYGLPIYKDWKSNDKISIYMYDKEIPWKLIYKGTCVCQYAEGSHYYDQSHKILYLCRTCNVRNVLYSLVSDRQVPFSADDWREIFLDNLIPRSELELREKEIQGLKDELEKYKREYGSLKGNIEDDVEVSEHGKDTEKDEIDEDTRKSINYDARVAAKEYLESITDYDCSAWNPENSGNLVCGLVSYKGKPINIAVTSSKSRKLYLHPRIVAEIMGNRNNILLNYGADNRIHSLTFDDIFKDNPNVNLIFDTDIVSPGHIAELANKYMYSRRTCFVIENPKYSTSDTIRSFGLEEKKTDGRVDTDISDEDLFNW